MMYRSFILPIILVGVVSFSSKTNFEKSNLQVKNTLGHQPSILSENIKKGKSLYEKNCIMCHGISGEGDGSAGIYLNPRPFDISSAKVQLQSDSTLFYKITIGKTPMPSFKQLPSESRQLLVTYIRELAQKK